jgi:hypothetical protein
VSAPVQADRLRFGLIHRRLRRPDTITLSKTRPNPQLEPDQPHHVIAGWVPTYRPSRKETLSLKNPDESPAESMASA